jgi:hypothetical protein
VTVFLAETLPSAEMMVHVVVMAAVAAAVVTTQSCLRSTR